MPRFWQILTKCMYVLVINHFYELVVYLLNSFLSSDCESTVFICHKQASCPVCEIISWQLIQSTADITIISYIFQWLSVQVHKTRFPTSTNLYFQRMQNWKDSWMDLVEKLNIFWKQQIGLEEIQKWSTDTLKDYCERRACNIFWY